MLKKFCYYKTFFSPSCRRGKGGGRIPVFPLASLLDLGYIHKNLTYNRYYITIIAQLNKF